LVTDNKLTPTLDAGIEALSSVESTIVTDVASFKLPLLTETWQPTWKFVPIIFK
jgi:hypothetical protein